MTLSTSGYSAGGHFARFATATPRINSPRACRFYSVADATRLNGREVQRSTTDLRIYSVPAIISYVSDFTTFEPGDVIEVEIFGIGTLRNRVEDERITPF